MACVYFAPLWATRMRRSGPTSGLEELTGVQCLRPNDALVVLAPSRSVSGKGENRLTEHNILWVSRDRTHEILGMESFSRQAPSPDYSLAVATVRR